MNELIKSFTRLKNNDLDNKAVSTRTALSNPPGSTCFPPATLPLASLQAALTACKDALASGSRPWHSSHRNSLSIFPRNRML